MATAAAMMVADTAMAASIAAKTKATATEPMAATNAAVVADKALGWLLRRLGLQFRRKSLQCL